MHEDWSSLLSFGKLVILKYPFSERTLELIYFEDSASFTELLSKYNGQITGGIKKTDTRTFYYLKNKILLVGEDNLVRKRYFICKSEDDFAFINAHFYIYYVGGHLITQSYSTNNADIKKFMVKKNPVELKRFSDYNSKVYLTQDGMCIKSTIDYFDGMLPIVTKEMLAKFKETLSDYENANYLDCFVYNTLEDAVLDGLEDNVSDE